MTQLRDDIVASFKAFSKIRGKRAYAETCQVMLESSLDEIAGGGEASLRANPNLPQTSDDAKLHKEELLRILDEINEFPDMQNFNLPVSKLVYPTYYQVIKKPMDLSKVIKNFKSNNLHYMLP